QVLVADPALPPDRLDELASAVGHPWALREHGQDVELGAGQRDRLIVQPYVTPGGVDGQGTEDPVPVVVGSWGADGPGPAQHGSQARDELAGAERLGEVVV